MVSALALAAIAAVISSAVGLLASSGESRQAEDTHYMQALQAAEAGVNYEINFMSVNGTTCPTTPQTVSAGSSFTVSAANANGGTWTSGPAVITSSGTYQGITREVKLTAAQTGLPLFQSNGFQDDPWAGVYSIFGEKSLTMTGNAEALSGNIGTDGTMTLTGNADSTGTGLVVGAGPNASLSTGGHIAQARIKTLANAVLWPTVGQLVAQQFSGGWPALNGASAIAAQAGRIRQFVGSTNSTLSPANTASANWPTSGRTATTITHTQLNSYPQGAIILTPGNYYITSINTSGNDNIVFDPNNLSTGGSPGMINVWMAGNATGDSLSGNVTMGTADPSMVRIYYDKPATFTLSGNSGYMGGFYAIRAGTSTTVAPATVDLTGNATVTMAIIGDQVTLTGNGEVQLATNSGTGGISNSQDPTNTLGQPYAFSNGWAELPATGGSVFADGTNN